MVDYLGALDMALPTNFSFDSCDPRSIVIHETGGDMTLDAVHNTFLATMRSTHFAIDQDGRVAQYVPLVRGAGGNCCPDKDASGNLLCDPYWYSFVQQYGNLNLCTISIEHCNNSTNSLPVTPAQQDASFALVLWLCRQYGIDAGHIKGHNSINPQSKPDCPGTYPMTDLIAHLRSNVLSTHQQEAILDRWNSFFEEALLRVLHDKNLAGSITPPPTGTGIYNAWLSLYLAGKQLGPATSYEYDSVDWGGNPIKCQDFGSCRIEYYYTTGVWHCYGPSGQIA